MEALKDIAKVYNIIEAKLQHSTVPLSLTTVHQDPDLITSKQTQIRDCLRHLVSKGMVFRVPVSGPGRDRVGYVWKTDGKAEPVIMAPVKPAAKLKEEIRLRINPDKSITILTHKFNITIEVPDD